MEDTWHFLPSTKTFLPPSETFMFAIENDQRILAFGVVRAKITAASVSVFDVEPITAKSPAQRKQK
jgi:hypothetical protein